MTKPKQHKVQLGQTELPTDLAEDIIQGFHFRLAEKSDFHKMGYFFT